MNAAMSLALLRRARSGAPRTPAPRTTSTLRSGRDTRGRPSGRLPATVVCLTLLLPVAGHALDGAASRAPQLPLYRQECAACHIAYPPALLPAPSWQRLMQGLPSHFGTDASLDPATVREISAWLLPRAAPARSANAAPPQDRITRSAWFVHEHDEVPPALWRHAAVRSPANCIACHPGAEQGDFDEHQLRLPR